jgi:hypothetical protein
MSVPIGDGVDIETDALTTFTERLIGPDMGAVAKAQPMACGGGMAECSTFGETEALAFAETTKFLTEEAQGFDAYKQIVAACRDEYLDRDLTSAAAIAQSFDAQER